MTEPSGSGRKTDAIVGLDPGTTFGVAALDLTLNPIYIKSLKSANSEEFVKELSKKCRPVLFTCDVDEAPDAVKKIAAIFDAGLFLPERNLSVHEKQRLVNDYLKNRPYLKKLLDAHSADALSSALKAFKSFKNRFQKIEALFRTLSSNNFKTTVKGEVVRGYSIRKAFRKILLEKADTLEQIENPHIIISKESVDELVSLRRKLTESRKAIENLKNENKELGSKLNRTILEKNHLTSILLKKKNRLYGTLDKDIIYTNQKKEISNLRQRLDEAESKIDSLTSMLKRFKKIKESGKAGDLILLKPIQNFTEEDVEEAIKKMGIKENDGIIIFNAAGGGPSTAKRLSDLKPKFIVVCTGMSHQAEEVFIDNGVPILSSHDIKIKYVNDIPGTPKEQAYEKIKQWKQITYHALSID